MANDTRQTKVGVKTKTSVASFLLATLAISALSVSAGAFAAVLGLGLARTTQRPFRVAISLGEAVNSGLQYSTVVGWASPTAPVCGNGKVESGEQCDPPGASCTGQCRLLGEVLWTYAPDTTMNVEYILSRPTLADINSDGALETLVTGWGYNYDIFALSSAGKFLWKAHYATGNVETPPVVADINNDGTQEIVYIATGRASNDGLYALDANGRKLWLATGNFRYGPVVGDLDGDNDMEIAVASNDSRLSVYDHAGKLLWMKRGTQPVITQLNSTTSRSHQLLAWEFDTLYAYDAGGTLIWQKSLQTGNIAPVVTNLDSSHELEAVVVENYHHDVVAFNARGDELWRWTSGNGDADRIFHRPVVVSGSGGGTDTILAVKDYGSTVVALNGKGTANLTITLADQSKTITGLSGIHDVDAGSSPYGSSAEELIVVIRPIGAVTPKDSVMAFNQRGERVWKIDEPKVVDASVGDVNRDGKIEVVVLSSYRDNSPGARVKVTAYTFPQSQTKNILAAPMQGLDIGNTNRVSQAFMRGDANGDRRLDVSDGGSITNYLICLNNAQGCENPDSLMCKVNQGLCYTYPDCADARDANDDGTVSVKDAEYLNTYLFLGGPQPPYPGINLGPDPTADKLGCEVYR